jgi:hypothetical protein
MIAVAACGMQIFSLPPEKSSLFTHWYSVLRLNERISSHPFEGTQRDTYQINSLFPRSCIEYIIERILSLSNGEHVPMLAITGSRWPLSFYGRQALHHALVSLAFNGARRN